MQSQREDGRHGPSGTGVSRREVLGSVSLLGAGVVAGCPGGAGERTRLDLEEPESPGMGVAVTEADLRDDQVALVRQAAADGTTTAHGYDPFRREDYVRVDGTYYRVRTEAGPVERVDKPVLVVTPAPDAGDTVALETYDSHVVELVVELAGENDSRVVLHHDTGGFDSLYPEPRHEFVTWKNTTYRLAVEVERVEQRARHVGVTAVADTPGQFRAYLRGTVQTAISSEAFSEPVREVFAEAVDGEYEETAPYSDAFETALDAVGRGRELDDGEWGETYLLVYDGILYVARIETTSSG
jgi:hypothetical protein